ncbi:MAG: MBL fold metallo-hydrolase [Deltaproteobacteria bacterium]|nr:MAG: MBL fold metallo-hydrolase [Deltaproteobacteria bacterium]
MFRPTVTAQDLQPSPEEQERLAQGGLVRIPMETGLNVGPVNITLVLGPKPALIDTALHCSNNLEQLEEALKPYNLSLESIEEIWLTHPHIDHFGLTGAIIERSGAQTYSLALGAYRFDDYLSFWHTDRQAFHDHVQQHGGPPDILGGILSAASTYHKVSSPFTIDHKLEPNQPVQIAGRYEVIPLHTPGHTPWCTSFWFPETKMLVAGDALRQKMRFNMILYTAEDVSQEHQGLACFQDSLRLLEETPAEWVIPGHGVSFSNHQKTIRHALKRQSKRCDLMENTLEDSGPMSAYEMAIHMYNKSITEDALLLVMSDTIALLEWLHHNERIERFTNEEVFHYKLP